MLGSFKLCEPQCPSLHKEDNSIQSQRVFRLIIFKKITSKVTPMESQNSFVMSEHGLFGNWRSPFRQHMLHMIATGSAQIASGYGSWDWRLCIKRQDRSHLMCTTALLHILEHHLLEFSCLTSIYIIGGMSVYRMFLKETGAEVLKKIKSVHVS